MIKRHFAADLLRKLKTFPLVTLLGPRQCGKTTFIRDQLESWTYVDLERPSDFEPLAADPEHWLNAWQRRVIFDEAQRLPALFPVLRSHVDGNRSRKGQFVLLGSASPALAQQMSESLAGRTSFIEMTPFRWNEVCRMTRASLLTLWFRGGFPDAFLERSDRARLDWFESYTRTFIERDLMALGIEISPVQMRKLWTMLAHVHGRVWNASPLAASLGTSYHTINRYTDILEQAFLVRRLPPYFTNIGKRLTKSPKIYLRDSGLLHYFLGIQSPAQLEVSPSRGASWEGFMVEHLISAFQMQVPGTQAFYWRTAAGAEVDILIQKGERLIPFEVKLHSAPTPQDIRGLRQCMADLKLSRGYLLYPGKEDYSLGHGVMVLSANRLFSSPEKCRDL